MAYLDSVMAMMNADYILYEIILDGDQAEQMNPAMCPEDWQVHPPPISTQDIGHQWYYNKRSVALMVPSVIVPQEYNILLNATHPEFQNLVISEPIEFKFDSRLAVT